METFDDTNVLDDIKNVQEKTPPYNTALKYGAIAGFGMVVLGLIFYLMDIFSQSAQLLSYVILLAAMIFGTIHHRDKELGGRMTFGRGVGIGVLITVVAAAIAGVWSYVFTNFIAPDIVDIIIEKSYESWEAFGMTEEQMEDAEKRTRNWMASPLTIPITILAMAFVGTIISLITSAILQKK